MSVDTTTPEYQQKVSEAEKRIESRLAELNRSKGEEQSPESNLGNSDGRNTSIGNSSSVIGDNASRAQSVASSGAKINKKLKSSKDLVEKMAKFVEDMPNNNTITPENFAKELLIGIGLNPSKNERSEYVHVINDGGDTYTLRISDHEGNARNIILRGVKTDKGYSIVLRTPDSPSTKFKRSKWAEL